MTAPRHTWPILCLVLAGDVFCPLASWAADEPGAPAVAAGEDPGMPLGLGGAGGVYFLAEPGELQLEIQKTRSPSRPGPYGTAGPAGRTRSPRAPRGRDP